MVKKVLKKLILMLIIAFLASSICISVMANNTGGDPMASLIEKVDQGNDSTNISTKVQGRFVSVMSAVKIAAVCVAVVMLLALAMKYMVAAPGEKAEIKKSATVYVVGAIVLFGVSGILTIIEQFSSVIKPAGGNG